MFKHAFFIIMCTMLLTNVSCSSNKEKPSTTEAETTISETEADCTCPHCRILIQPYGKFSRARAIEVSKQLQEALGKHMGGLAVTDVQVLPNKPLTEDLMNKAKTRYRARKILEQQRGLLEHKGDAIIGLTDSDISTTLHNHEDWGILGLSFLKQANCVISTYRVKDKSQFWKVVLHEFGHGFLGLPHCPNNDRRCFMVDANGKPDLAKQRYFCDSCSKYIPK